MKGEHLLVVLRTSCPGFSESLLQEGAHRFEGISSQPKITLPGGKQI